MISRVVYIQKLNSGLATSASLEAEFLCRVWDKENVSAPRWRLHARRMPRVRLAAVGRARDTRDRENTFPTNRRAPTHTRPFLSPETDPLRRWGTPDGRGVHVAEWWTMSITRPLTPWWTRFYIPASMKVSCCSSEFTKLACHRRSCYTHVPASRKRNITTRD